MNCPEVYDYLEELADLSQVGDAELCKKICSTSLREIMARLRSDADRSDIRITAAAAALANYKLTLRRCADESLTGESVTSFKAGDVNITQDRTDFTVQLVRAEKLLQEKLIELTPLCADNSFAVKNVRIEVKI